MNTSAENGSRTRLSDRQFEECMSIVRHYLKSNPFIQNRGIRAIASIGYDQAIHFFNRAIAEKILVREGRGSRTCYVLPDRKDIKR